LMFPMESGPPAGRWRAQEIHWEENFVSRAQRQGQSARERSVGEIGGLLV